MKIKFFGVGAALNESMDNTYFLIEDGKNKLQVDCGGGIGLAQRVRRKEAYFENLFITHKHSDHFYGFFHLPRLMKRNELNNLNIFTSKDVEKTIRGITELSNSGAGKKFLEKGQINFINIDNLEKQNIGEYEIEPINLNSSKIEQFGFILKYNGIKVVFFGDEAVGVLERNDLEKMKGADYLICESLTLDSNDIKNGGNVELGKISHISAKHAGRIGKKLEVKNLILIHTHEFVGEDRKKLLKEDAKTEFSGNIIVPDDGEEIIF